MSLILYYDKGYDFSNKVFWNGVKTQQIYEFDYDDLKQIWGNKIIKNIYNGQNRPAYLIAIYKLELRFYDKNKIHNLKIKAAISALIYNAKLYIEYNHCMMH